MANEFWLTIEEVSDLTGEVKETVRRKCKRGEYTSIFYKKGKYKIYYVALESLPEYTKKKYFGIKNSSKHSKFFKEAPPWAKKQAEKYLELFKLTENMKHKEIVEFLKKWNEEHPDKKSSYPALFKAKAKFKNFGEDALLSKKGFKDCEYKVKPEFYEYYKNLYLSKSALSIYNCWLETFYYAKEHHKINISNFPNEKTFDRLLKKDISPFVIEQARKKHEKIFARDLENINTNEYWYTETYQFNFQIKHRHTYFYPWITVVKDIKTSKWLGWFVYHEPPNPDHILQAVYYALIKYGNPKELFIKDEKIKSFINRAGQVKKADITLFDLRTFTTLSFANVRAKTDLPKSLVIKSISKDLKGFLKPDREINLWDFKTLIDKYIEQLVNSKPFRTQRFAGKTPNDLWNETFVQEEFYEKDNLKFLCFKHKNLISIRRNQICDSLTGKRYWAGWIVHCCCKKLCIRRDIYSDDNAYIYDGNNGKFIGAAEVDYPVKALARTPEEKAHLHKKMERKRAALKEIQNFLSTLHPIPIEEQLENYKCVYASEKEDQEQQKPKIVKVLRTKMDDVVKQAREMEEREKLRSALLEFESSELDEF